MPRLRTVCSTLLASTLIIPGVNVLLGLVEVPDRGAALGAQVLRDLERGGLMPWIAAGHVLVGVLLLMGRTRFAAALMQLPITLGIVAFNAVLLPAGVPLALAMLALNVGAVWSPPDVRRLLAPAPA